MWPFNRKRKDPKEPQAGCRSMPASPAGDAVCMRVSGCGAAWDVADEEGLEAVLRQRDPRGGGDFWLSGGDDTFPCLGIRVSGPHSDIHYFPEDRHPGFRCLGGEGLPSEGTTTFVFDGCDPAMGEDVPNDFVVSFDTAVVVAKEFFRTRELPVCCEWFEL